MTTTSPRSQSLCGTSSDANDRRRLSWMKLLARLFRIDV
jgi:hypothetical protein